MMMSTTSAAGEAESRPATTRSIARRGSITSSTPLRLKRRSRSGAPHTLETASMTPQPKKVSPIPKAPKPSGNGEKARRTKKPML